MTPFHTGRVQIGIRYTKPMNKIEGDAVTIQEALLCRFTHRRENLWHLIVNRVWQWL